MKNRSKFHFVLGFILGAIIFGSAAAAANTVIANAVINTVVINGKETRLSSYNINGSNYFQLRELGAALNFSVAWDSQRNVIIIDANQPHPTGNRLDPYLYSATGNIPVETPIAVFQPAAPGLSQNPAEVTPAAAAVAPATGANPGIEDIRVELVKLINEERNGAGLSNLKVFSALEQSAQLKADDFRLSSYYGHKSPVYGASWEMIYSFTPEARHCGEIIAPWNRTPADAFVVWKNSPAHYAQIMEARFTHIGIGIMEGSNNGYWWVVHFAEI